MAGLSNGGFGGTLWVVDISDVSTPTLAATFTESEFGATRGVHVIGDYIYMTEYSLKIFDISDPTEPVKAGGYGNLGFSDVVFSNDTAYAVGYYNDFEIININDPITLTQIGKLNGQMSSISLAISGNYAYVISIDSGLKIIDINIPTAPTLVVSYPMQINYDSKIIIRDDNAFVTTGGPGISIININDPASPVLVAKYQMTGIIYDILISGEYVFIANGSSRIPVLDISDPENIKLAYSYYTKGNSTGLFIDKNYLYSADGWAGLSIISLADSIPLTTGLEISLTQNRETFLQSSPNPFNFSTRISWNGFSSDVRFLKIYNSKGEMLKHFDKPSSTSVVWNASQFPQGIYFATIRSKKHILSKKLFLQK